MHDPDFYLRNLERLQEYTDVTDETRQRFTRWLGESLAWAIREHLAGRPVHAMRGLLQAKEYLGRIGGFYPTPVTHDAAIALQNAIEDDLRKAGAS
jgi:hypothetical protein